MHVDQSRHDRTTPIRGLFPKPTAAPTMPRVSMVFLFLWEKQKSWPSHFLQHYPPHPLLHPSSEQGWNDYSIQWHGCFCKTVRFSVTHWLHFEFHSNKALNHKREGEGMTWMHRRVLFVCVCRGPSLRHRSSLLFDCRNAFTTLTRTHVLTHLKRPHQFKQVFWGQDWINSGPGLHLSNAPFALSLMHMCHKDCISSISTFFLFFCTNPTAYPDFRRFCSFLI